MPTIFAIAAPPRANVPLIVGSMILGITLLGGIAAFTARETARDDIDSLGDDNALPESPQTPTVFASEPGYAPAARPSTTKD
jgi:hypothetical protein